MIQAYYKYRPASFEALALLACADSNDRLAQRYQADMLRMIMLLHIPPAERNPEEIPSLAELLSSKPRKKITAEKATDFVDNMIAAFRKGGVR